VDNVIETLNLTKRFGRITAVDAVSITVGRGQVFGFLGPNGSGKTTTMGMLLDIITPTSGEIRLLGEYGRAGLHRARQRVGATLEQPNFYPHLSGYENLRVTALLKRVEPGRIMQALEEVGLAERARSPFSTYSLGMKQRLAVASAMLGDPEIVFLDEPMNGLDPDGMREMRDIIARLRDRGRTVFLSSHLLNEVERSCTHVAIIKKGRILAQGSLAEILRRQVAVVVQADDPIALDAALAEYPPATRVRQDNGFTVVELEDDDPAAMNGFLANRGVLLSYLMPRQRTLEDVFMEVTTEERAEVTV